MENSPKWQNFAVVNFFQWPILDLAQCVSAVFCTVTCTAHITSCKHLLSCVTAAWVRLPGSHLSPPTHTPHSLLCQSYVCILTPQKASVCGPQFSPQRVDPAPSGTFQLDRPEGEAGCDPNDLCVKPRLSLSHCAHVWDFTRFHISFSLFHLFFFCVFLFFPPLGWEITAADSRSFQPHRQKEGGDRRNAGEETETKVSGTHFTWAASQVERAVCSPPDSCAFSSASGHDARCMARACVKLKLTISQYCMAYWGKQGMGLPEYWLTECVHPQIHTHTSTHKCIHAHSSEFWMTAQNTTGKIKAKCPYNQYDGTIPA